MGGVWDSEGNLIGTRCDYCGRFLDYAYDGADIDLAICKYCNETGEAVSWVTPPEARTTPVPFLPGVPKWPYPIWPDGDYRYTKTNKSW
jgi:hypothetical protein